MIKKKMRLRFLILLATVSMFLMSCGNIEASKDISETSDTTETTKEATVESEEDDSEMIEISEIAEDTETIDLSEIPEYSGTPYVAINGNVPEFTEDEIEKAVHSFEEYGELDSMGRCTMAIASVGQDLMPAEERESIGQIKPSGWHTIKYDIVDGKYLYNRCHLIGYQLTAENANERNLITGTRYLNIDGMLPFEDLVADYVKETANHVLYLVKPIYDGDNLVANGVQMEGYSVEDRGEDICFNVFVYNVQPGVAIDYATGESHLEEIESGESGTEEAETKEPITSSAASQGEIRGNKESKIYHCPGQAYYDQMADSKNLVIFQTEQEAIDAGYRKAKRC